MSNTDQHVSNIQQKQIKIKPIEHIRKKAADNMHKFATVDEERNVKQREVQEMNQQLDHARVQGAAILTETQEMIAKEKKQWEDQKQQLIAEAKDLGYKEGFSIGKEESLIHYAGLLNKANEIIDSASEDYYAILESSEDTVVKLAIHSAEKIIQVKLAENPEAFIPIVKAAIKDIKEQSMVSIYLHPDNYHVVFSQKDELSRLLDSDAKLVIYAKEDMQVNHCLIEHPFGQIDASVDTQLKQLRAVLHEVNMENKQ